MPRSYHYNLFQAAAQRKTQQLIAPLNTPDEYVYIPDAAKTLLRLMDEEGACGRTWHLAGAGRITLSELIKLLESITGRQLRKFVVGKRSLQLLETFNPVFHKAAEMHYLLTQPL